MRRDTAALESREHDVVVIGGGIAGAWTVWEAASRGLKAALIEQNDFGQATSWSSLKTAHGGLRHLQRLDIGGFRESVRERRALLRVAPQIVRCLPFVVPAEALTDRIKYFAGGIANDALSFDRNEGLDIEHAIAGSRLLSASEYAAQALGAALGRGGFLWYDAQIVFTERLLLALLHAAFEADATIANHCRVESASPDPDGGFTLRCRDVVSEGALTVRAKSVVNAAGAQIEQVAKAFGQTCASPAWIRGANVVLRGVPSLKAALGARDRGKFLFLSPWRDRLILGTVYDDGTPAESALVDELIQAGRRAFPWAGIEPASVCAVHSGHVPSESDGEPIYRSRVIGDSQSRFVSILSAKYTTARATAESAIDRLATTLDRRLPPSRSAVTELPRARPLCGTLLEQSLIARDDEMAVTPQDALRGRLEIGARGLSREEAQVFAAMASSVWP